MSVRSSISSIIATSPFASGLPLDDLLAQLGSATLRRIVRPDSGEGGIAPPVQGVAFLDADAVEQLPAGQLLLLTSHAMLPDDRVAELCSTAAASRASGIVARAIPADAPLAVSCARHGLPLFELDPQVDWRQFDALVSRLLGEHGSGLQLGPTSGDKLFSLANSIAGVFRGSVAIEDHRRNILAYSAMPDQAIDDLRANGILYRRVPDKSINEVRYRQMFAAQGVARFARSDTEAPRAAIAIRAGSIPLGSIWAIDPDGEDLSLPLAPAKQEVLEQGALLAADYLVDAWRFDHGDTRSREAALRRALQGAPQENDQTVLGFRPTQQVVLAALLPNGERSTDAELGEIRTGAARHLSVYFPGSVCVALDGAVVALVPSGSAEEVGRSFARLLPELRRLTGAECRVGLDEPRRFRRSLSGRHERARLVAECARERGLEIATTREVQAQLVLRECGAALRGARLSTEDAEALLEPDAADARATLLTWLEEQGSAPRVAARLRLHEQTVRYRVRQAVARYGLDLDDADRMLALWLQLRTSATDRRG